MYNLFVVKCIYSVYHMINFGIYFDIYTYITTNSLINLWTISINSESSRGLLFYSFPTKLPETNTDRSSVSTEKCCLLFKFINGITQCVLFCVWFLVLHIIMFNISICSQLLSNTSWHEYSIKCSPIFSSRKFVFYPFFFLS